MHSMIVSVETCSGRLGLPMGTAGKKNVQSCRQTVTIIICSCHKLFTGVFTGCEHCH